MTRLRPNKKAHQVYLSILTLFELCNPNYLR